MDQISKKYILGISTILLGELLLKSLYGIQNNTIIFIISILLVLSLLSSNIIDKSVSPYVQLVLTVLVIVYSVFIRVYPFTINGTLLFSVIPYKFFVYWILAFVRVIGYVITIKALIDGRKKAS